jgi:hypothetical protein
MMTAVEPLLRICARTPKAGDRRSQVSTSRVLNANALG